MARALMKLFGDRVALVGISTGSEPLGQWTDKVIDGKCYRFFPAARRKFTGAKPVIPARLSFYRALRTHKSAIRSLPCRAAFIQAPEALLAVSGWSWDHLCFWFAGVENPLTVSRYHSAALLSRFFDASLFSALEKVGLILAAADEDAMGRLLARSKGRLSKEQVVHLPTCVDTSKFYPAPMYVARACAGLPGDCNIFVNSGRIGRLKGWELLLDAFVHYRRTDPSALLIFVGDGEDKPHLREAIRARDLQRQVEITGFQNPDSVATYLSAANVAVFGSYTEGWSVAMLEALACGKPIVSTCVSGSGAMVRPGQNGFVVHSREPAEFATAMENALRLEEAEETSLSIARRYALSELGRELERLWPPFAPKTNVKGPVLCPR